jgi:hypothetical protein
VVAGERGRIRLNDLIGDDDVAIAAITVAEDAAAVEDQAWLVEGPGEVRCLVSPGGR